MLFLGAGLMFVGGGALLMMHVTGNIPNQLPMKWRHEDAGAFRRWRAAYAAVLAVGIILLLTGLLRA